MGDTGQPRLVKALYSYNPKNTDELAFFKGDVITLTQTLDGGWWEGTLKEITGWFPSNYVTDFKGEAGQAAKVTKQHSDIAKEDNNTEYRKLVINSIIDSEKTLVTEVQTFIKQFIRPLSSANMLTSKEFSCLVGNLEELYTLHQHLLQTLEECFKLAIKEQRVGGVLLKQAVQLQSLYKTYCGHHPKAVQVLQKHKNELNTFTESLGAPAPGCKALTTGLSLPFSRLDKYPNLLKELERYTDVAHPDRGDTQRALAVYKEISENCTEIRRQKELESEIIHSSIKGWEGQDISSFGEVLLLSHVIVQTHTSEKTERLFLLFPNMLIMLSVTPQNSTYHYEGKLPVGGMMVNPLEDTEHSTNLFEITGKMIERIVVSCTTSQEQKQWVELLRKQSKLSPPHFASKPQSLQISANQPSIKTVQPQTARMFNRTPTGTHTLWSTSCLCPNPPSRPTLYTKDEANRSPKLGRKILGSYRKKTDRAYSDIDDQLYQKRNDDAKIQEEDSLILHVIEAYCTSAKARHTINSSAFDTPSVIIAEEEKIIIEEQRDGEIVIEERTLVDTVYHLRDQVKELRTSQAQLRKDFEEERKTRKKMETLLRKTLNSMSLDSGVPGTDDSVISNG